MSFPSRRSCFSCSCSSLFGKRLFRYEDFSGYRSGRDGYGTRAILYDREGRSRLSIAGYFEHPQQIQEWLKEHFRNLDLADAEREKTLPEKEAPLLGGKAVILPRLRRAVVLLNGFSVVTGAFLTSSGTVGTAGLLTHGLTFLLLLVPLLTLALKTRFPELIRFERTVFRSKLLDASRLSFCRRLSPAPSPTAPIPPS